MKARMKTLRAALALTLVTLLCQQTCLAQVDPWERVKLIEPGKNVHVRLHSGKTVKGKMDGWSPDAIGVRQGKEKLVRIGKSDVAEVALVTGMSRGRKATYAGLITGGVLGGIVGVGCARGGCEGEPAQYLPAAVAGWALIAAGIAALFPPHKEVLYTALSAPPATEAYRK